MIDTIYLEDAVASHPRARALLARYKSGEVSLEDLRERPLELMEESRQATSGK